MSNITEKTLVPVGLAILVIGGGAGWMTKQEINNTANAATISQVKSDFNGLSKVLQEILQRLGTIEGELKRIPKKGG